VIPSNNYLGTVPAKTVLDVLKTQPAVYASATAVQGHTPVPLKDDSVAPAGGDQPHNNLQPYLTLNFCIALQGVYPPRT